jgi:hypothetical protein
MCRYSPCHTIQYLFSIITDPKKTISLPIWFMEIHTRKSTYNLRASLSKIQHPSWMLNCFADYCFNVETTLIYMWVNFFMCTPVPTQPNNWLYYNIEFCYPIGDSDIHLSQLHPSVHPLVLEWQMTYFLQAEYTIRWLHATYIIQKAYFTLQPLQVLYILHHL